MDGRRLIPHPRLTCDVLHKSPGCPQRPWQLGTEARDPFSFLRVSEEEALIRQRLLGVLGDRSEFAVRPSTPPEEPVARSEIPPLEDTSAISEQSAPSRWLGDLRAFDPGRRGVKALALVAAVVALGAAVWAWRSRPEAEPVPLAAPLGQAEATTAPGATESGEVIVVAVAGKVRQPGLVRLPPGARVADAIEAAGGALPGVDTALLNLARKVNDGELILVGVTPPPGLVGGYGDAGSVAGGKVNLNTATQAQLETLPGVGPVLAQRILTFRERNGGFRSVADLRRVDEIGRASCRERV